ncbi:DoxX family protein [Pseudactinotalea sp. Z1732]|uniref:DoxX family protein n=1 Tax=Micrococcales TaxID=85006 RepID=UPI003C7AE152
MTTTEKVPNVHLTTQEDIVTRPGLRKVLAVSRIVIGFTFLWAFLDKLFGLSYATPAERAWINGGTPAQGFIGGIENFTGGFFSLFQNAFGDVLFMLGLLGIGVAMIAGAGLRIAAITGTALMVFMWLATFPVAGAATNPILTSHWHEALLLIIAALTLSGDTWGLGKWWANKGFVQKNSWLR